MTNHINEFTDSFKPGYDNKQFRQLLIEKLLAEYGGHENHFTIWEIIDYFFDENCRDLETMFYVQRQLAILQPKLEKEYGLFLAHERIGNGHFRYVVKNANEAEIHIDNFNRRAINAIKRTSTKSQIGIESYGLLPNNSVIQVSQGLAEPLDEVKKLEEKAKQHLLENKDK